LGTFIYWQLKRWAKYQHGNKNRWWIFHRYFHDNHFTDLRITKKGIEHNRLFRIAYVPIQYHIKVKAKANPFLKEYDNYFYQRTKWREDLAIECKQITTFMSNKDSKNSWVTLRRSSLLSA
jgi:RNA-directed DNA polymerase